MWLVGMMGSGKSTVGASAADRLGVPFYDTDRMVVARAGMEITEIWETLGEEELAYQRVATHLVDTGGRSVDEVTAEVVAICRS